MSSQEKQIKYFVTLFILPWVDVNDKLIISVRVCVTSVITFLQDAGVTLATHAKLNGYVEPQM